MSWQDDIWGWLKKAPVAALLIAGFVGLGIPLGYAKILADDNKAAAAEAKDVANKAKEKADEVDKKAEKNKDTVESNQKQLDEISKDIKKLIEAVGQLQGELKAARRKE